MQKQHFYEYKSIKYIIKNDQITPNETKKKLYI